MQGYEKIWLRATDFAGKEQALTVDGRWFGDDLVLVWQWDPVTPDKPKKTLTIEEARAGATRDASGQWRLEGNYTYPGFFATNS